MRYTNKLACLSGLLLSTVPTVAQNHANHELKKQPNVLFLIMDDLRPELGCYGASYMHTPNIDALANSSVQFNNAYCNIPVSGASRASIFTGLRPGKKRFWDVRARIDKEAPNVQTLAQCFKEQGYVTISNSKVIHGKNDTKRKSWSELWMSKPASKTWRDYLGDENQNVEKQRGAPSVCEAFDVEDDEYIDGKTVNKSITDLKRLKKTGQPFFLAVGILKPHLPFNAPKRYWDLYSRNDIKLPDTYEIDKSKFPKKAFHKWNEIRYYNQVPMKGDVTEETAKQLIHGYRACVSYADAQVGKLMNALHKLGLDENTIVVFVGDHGWSLGDHRQWCKHSNFNIVNRSPLMVRYPGLKSARKENKVVEFVDLYPTLCEMTHIKAPNHLQGESFFNLMKNPKSEWKDCAIIKWHSGLTYFDRNYGYTIWKNQNGKITDEMLFDYSSDKKEIKNCANDSKYKSIKLRLRKEIDNRKGKDFNLH